MKGNIMEVNVQIPVNTFAEVVLKGASQKSVSESGQPFHKAAGIEEVKVIEGGLSIKIGSGFYRFTYQMDFSRPHYNWSTKIHDILGDEHATNIVQKHAPHLLVSPFARSFRKFTFKEIAEIIRILKYIPLLIMMIPGLIYLVINNYLPMVGIIIAFKKMNFAKGIFGSDWVGFANFEYLFKT